MTKRFLLCLILMICCATLYFVTQGALRPLLAPPAAARAPDVQAIGNLHVIVDSSNNTHFEPVFESGISQGTIHAVSGSVTQPVGGVFTTQGAGATGTPESCRRYNADRSSWCDACTDAAFLFGRPALGVPVINDCIPPAPAPPAPPKHMRMEWDQRDAIIFETTDAYHAWSGWSGSHDKCVSTERDTWTCYPHGGRLVEVEGPKRKVHERDSLTRVWLGPNEEMCLKAWAEDVEYCARNDTKAGAYFDLKARVP